MADKLPNQDQTVPAVPVSPGVRREHEAVSIMVTPLDQEGLPPVEVPKPLEQTVVSTENQPLLDAQTPVSQSVPPHHVTPMGTVYLPGDYTHIELMSIGKKINDAILWIKASFGRQKKKMELQPA